MTPIISPTAVIVEQAIMAQTAFLEIFEVSVVENNGVVALHGKVPSKQYLQLAESIAKRN